MFTRLVTLFSIVFLFQNVALAKSHSIVNYLLITPIVHNNPSVGDFLLNVDKVVSESRTPKSLIVLPGGPGLTADYLKNSQLTNYLKKEFDIYFIHPRGSRKSPLPDDYSIHYEANSVEQLLEDVGWVAKKLLNGKAFYILGHSFGGTLATLYSGIYPEKIIGSICLNCSPDTSNWEKYLETYFEGDFPYVQKHIEARELGEGETKIFLNLWNKLKKMVLADEAEYELGDGELWKMDRVDLRSVFRPILQRKTSIVKKYIQRFLNKDPQMIIDLKADWKWSAENDNLTVREFMYCNELIPELALGRKIFETEKTWFDFYCHDYKLNRPRVRDENKIKRQITAKVLVFWGKYDFIVPFDEIKSLYEPIANKVVIQLEESSHYSYNQQPKVIWNKIKEHFNE